MHLAMHRCARANALPEERRAGIDSSEKHKESLAILTAGTAAGANLRETEQPRSSQADSVNR
jgi:hypothetical protein